MSTGNPLVDAMDQLANEVAQCRAAVQSADPAALRQSVDAAAGRAVATVQDAARMVGAAVADAKAAADAARQAAAEVTDARKDAKTWIWGGLVIALFLGFGAGLLSGIFKFRHSAGTAEACIAAGGTVSKDAKSGKYACNGFWLNPEE